jgi:hypothetical protein
MPQGSGDGENGAGEGLTALRNVDRPSPDVLAVARKSASQPKPDKSAGMAREPLTSSHVLRFCGSLSSSLVTNQGPDRPEGLAALAFVPLAAAALDLEDTLAHG